MLGSGNNISGSGWSGPGRLGAVPTQTSFSRRISRPRSSPKRRLPRTRVELAGIIELDQAAAQCQHQFEIDGRMALREVAQQGGEATRDEILGSAEAHAAMQLRPAKCAARALMGLQDNLGMGQHRVAIGGQHDRMGVAHEQAAADLLLQPGDMLADRGLAQVEPPRRLAEAVCLGHHLEAAEQGRVEHRTRPFDFSIAVTVLSVYTMSAGFAKS